MPKIKIDGRAFGLGTLSSAYQSPIEAALAAGPKQAVARGAELLKEILDSDQTVYGINTGFGLLASQKISADDLGQLQTNLVLSHAAGTGAPIADRVVRLIMLLSLIHI